ncbi:caspase family protein [Pleurocapsa sp. FMAR1]|uniref:caspase family protein n=1 Tax=Pleurocapsa sp. FMAR1 TaxID=3040204 RepID=UPI0029C99C01|nr:caspase family protein [Pleurocapsa sp. FMAR1]
MGLDRRTFLQQAGLALFTWGATEAGISSLDKDSQLAALVKNYHQTLAESTSRKLALLVGINRYPDHEHLDGCLTDVELQRELLIHRFGFNPQDIVTLCDRQATRENIETAFIEHLAQQAQADDVVVFHFSGYGGQIKMPLSTVATANDTNNPDPFKLVNSFVPVDGVLPSQKTSIANSILQDTLLVLAQSLSTSKCTFVLDTSFNTTPGSKHGSLKVRSVSEVAESSSPQELIFLEQLRSDFAAKGLKPTKRLLSLPGVVLSASSNNQVAAERHWNGFSAGLFTHALTQHLWHLTPSNKVQIALARTAATVEQTMGRQQQPSLNSPEKSAIAYYLATSDAPNATGVVSKVSNNIIEVKLLGLPATILDCYGVYSCLRLLSADGLDATQLQIQSKAGLVSKTKLIQPGAVDSPLPGQLVRESIRMLERNLGINLALDADMPRIERVDATSAIANISGVNSATASGEQNADCLLGKIERISAKETGNSNTENQTSSYGLYTAGGELISKTTGVDEEAVKIAIDRLKPQFNNLLAAKWLKLTDNEFSSGLKAGASLSTVTTEQPINLHRTTLIAEDEQLPAEKKQIFPGDRYSTVPILIKGSDVQLSLSNTSDRPLYLLILGINSDSSIFALYTPTKSTPAEAQTQLKNLEIASGDELTVPSVEDSWKWKVSDSVGINTLYAVFSVQPFAKTLTALANQPTFKLDQEQILNVTNPVAVVNSLMEDLHAASSVSPELLPNGDVYALDVNHWATLSFIYEVANS